MMKAKAYNNTTKLFCIECNCEVDAVLVSGRDVYPHRPDLHALMLWRCPNCGNHVGTHKKTGIALGCIPNAKMKIVRKQIHSILDPIWQQRVLSRVEVYERISRELGYTYHTAELRNLKEANKVIDILTNLKKDLTRGNENFN